MMVNVEKELIRFFSETFPKITVCADVPKTRPKRFITLERTGGRQTRFLDYPQIAVQAWAESKLDASELAYQARQATLGLVLAPWVAAVTPGGLYSFPDPESRQARYQFTLELVVTTNR
ncbi:hypothetical protein CJ184_006330 [Actinotignum urinale]|nr:hypothetical protein [Actinotignum urinale]WIK58859.1 hypothetical protein CJ184_006330 [Actinotignum urinale]